MDGVYYVALSVAQAATEFLPVSSSGHMLFLKGLLGTLHIPSIFDVIVHGHTHRAGVHRKGNTLVVNPGEACGYLSGRSTIALFDTDNQKANIIEL